MVAHCKYSYAWEPDIFTAEIYIANITNKTNEHNYNLR